MQTHVTVCSPRLVRQLQDNVEGQENLQIADLPLDLNIQGPRRLEPGHGRGRLHHDVAPGRRCRSYGLRQAEESGELVDCLRPNSKIDMKDEAGLSPVATEDLPASFRDPQCFLWALELRGELRRSFYRSGSRTDRRRCGMPAPLPGPTRPPPRRPNRFAA